MLFYNKYVDSHFDECLTVATVPTYQFYNDTVGKDNI